MLHAFVILLSLFGFTLVLSQRISRSYRGLRRGIVIKLFFFHYALTVAYYVYSLFNPSDSRAYHSKVILDYRGPDWLSFYGTSTTFIEFLGYPLIKFLSIDYQGVIVLFSYLGFIGFVLFYIFFIENIKTTVKYAGVNLILLVLFLPNFHFWTSSFGKGSVIFFAVALIFYSLNNLRYRFWSFSIGLILAYHIRPHIMFAILVSVTIGFLLSSARVSVFQRTVMLIFGGAVLAFVFNDVLAVTGLDEDLFGQVADLSDRAASLARASSGIDISNYNIVEKLFAFLFRPLFFDAPGLLGVFISFENLLYLLFMFNLFKANFWRFLWRSDYVVKASFLSFLTVALALAQITGNLGLAIRQKSQVLMLILFVMIKYLDTENLRVSSALKFKRKIK